MTLIKDVFTEEWVSKLGHRLGFEQEFCQKSYSTDWDDLSFKERVRRLSVTMHDFLPDSFDQAAEWLEKNAPDFNGLAGIVFPDYIEVYGQEDWDRSLTALEILTSFSTSEFAIRPFLIRDQERCFSYIEKWTGSGNEHVRRLASEGTRPRLPWGQAIPSLIQDPSPSLPILKRLLKDPSLYVRKSVANHLNDISKTHPEVVLSIVKAYQGQYPHTDWILRHACRTLLKRGHPEALKLFGFNQTDGVKVESFLVPRSVEIGESLTFGLTLTIAESQKIRLDFAVDYVKKKGTRNRKVFKLSEGEAKAGKKQFNRKLSFADLTTRKHYPGTHTLTILINGIEAASADFEVM
ncbi:DNA alkylation repair protein [Jeotgalibacillus sp. R-1-5s-1]|uniref:DNA alkylation repair protein n=1 Tax=Jeotgalibacillus sp. R-1-5s-1 TaxID=2555897 RepID=UPI0010699835|nr:DNA alkylation repair protein [Jeotgalibacillus sp. R-1-5s-1]TFD99898.1 DNA alkylation repair protein [Jeotgalibacillus sp. R-1-5s-1]